MFFKVKHIKMLAIKKKQDLPKNAINVGFGKFLIHNKETQDAPSDFF
jgi:hypothetical protein